MAVIRTLLLIVITALVTIFVVQNLATIEVAFLTWAFAAPRALIFAMIFALGVTVGWLAWVLRPRPRGATPNEPTDPPTPSA